MFEKLQGYSLKPLPLPWQDQSDENNRDPVHEVYFLQPAKCKLNPDELRHLKRAQFDFISDYRTKENSKIWHEGRRDFLPLRDAMIDCFNNNESRKFIERLPGLERGFLLANNTGTFIVHTPVTLEDGLYRATKALGVLYSCRDYHGANPKEIASLMLANQREIMRLKRAHLIDANVVTFEDDSFKYTLIEDPSCSYERLKTIVQ